MSDVGYVDGFVVPVPKAAIEAYTRIAADMATIWRDHGALSVIEALGDDTPHGDLTSFPRSVQVREDEMVIFAYITYRSRAHRDEVMAKVMADPRLAGHDPAGMPFDTKRMIWGGFSVIVDR